MNFSWRKNQMKLRYYNMEKRGRDGYYVKNKEREKERKKR